MENWRCNIVFPRQTTNMAPIVGGTFKTLLYTHAHTHTHIHHQSSYPFDFGLLSQMVQTSWVFSVLLSPSYDWLKVLFLTCKNSDIHMHHKHVAQTVCLYLELSLIEYPMREGGPKRWWCLVCPFQQCRLLALLTHDSVRYVTIPTANNWQFPSKTFNFFNNKMGVVVSFLIF
jgi:hypothetical protein